MMFRLQPVSPSECIILTSIVIFPQEFDRVTTKTIRMRAATGDIKITTSFLSSSWSARKHPVTRTWSLSKVCNFHKREQFLPSIKFLGSQKVLEFHFNFFHQPEQARPRHIIQLSQTITEILAVKESLSDDLYWPRWAKQIFSPPPSPPPSLSHSLPPPPPAQHAPLGPSCNLI